MRKYAWVGAAALVAGLTLGLGAPAMAFGVLTVTEDPVNGWVGAIPTSSPAIMVGSDGESPFDPFGAGFDTSDGIVLNANWAPDPAYAAAFGANGWQQLPNSFTWVLPACINHVCENGNVNEPIAKWDFTPGGVWTADTLSIRMLDPDGKFSDLVLVANDGPGGTATILFNSGVPEAGTWMMMTAGLAGLGLVARRSRKRSMAPV